MATTITQRRRWKQWADHDILTESARKDAKSEDTILVAFMKMVGLLVLGMVLLILTMQLLGQMPVRSSVEHRFFGDYFTTPPPPTAPATQEDAPDAPAQQQRSVSPPPVPQPVDAE